MKQLRWTLSLLLLAAPLAGCGEDDPEETPDAAMADASLGPDATADAGTDAAVVCRADGGAGFPGVDTASCTAASTDYTPRVAGSSTDTWAACISDDNSYHPFNASISTVARIAGFEAIATKLWGGAQPSAQDFIDARVTYLEANGLESRVSRREDEHYPAAPAACNTLDATTLAANAERCAGPARIAPIINAAFTAGGMGMQPRVNAARIEAALLWFLLISPFKEARTCATAAADCDSAWAYYTGGEPRSGGLGLARYVRALSPATHDRIWDGALAVRCWRDLDNPTGAAANLTLRDQAVAQLDKAVIRGLAVVLRDRIARLDHCGMGAQADLAFAQVLGLALDRAASAANPAMATVLRTQLAMSDPSQLSRSAVIGALDALFPCP